MERVVTANEMKWCDQTTIKDVGVPGLVLMENAGREVSCFVRDTLGTLAGRHLVIFCGKGNNGGDGFVVARHLANTGAIISVILTSSSAELRGDALSNFKVLKRIASLNAPVISIQRYSRSVLNKLTPVDGIVDAIFGTGFSGTVRQPLAGLIRWINRQSAPVFAVDIPSGLDATNGIAGHESVRARYTITFGIRKRGLLLNDGQTISGIVRVADIGIPNIVAESKTISRTFLTEKGDVKVVLPPRPKTAHKYSVGKVLVIAGSKGLTGAAALCATAALRSGAGAVLLATPETVYPVLSRKLSEVMVVALPSTAQGTLSTQCLETLKPRLEWADVIAIGPGLSQNTETQAVVLGLLGAVAGKIVLDADGLNAVSADGVAALKKSRAEIILTPHSGEFGRLAKEQSTEVDRNRIELPRQFASRSGTIVVLKGAPTVTATPDGSVYINSTGNPGMATVGSGDVLTGIIAGIWAQGMTAESAAYAGVYIHGLAGDRAKKKFGERSLVAGDLIDCLPGALSSIESEEDR